MTAKVPPYPAGRDLLAGKTVLITAAAGTGIGFAAARRCAEEGARLVISDIHERRLEAAAAEIEKIGGARPATVVCNAFAWTKKRTGNKQATSVVTRNNWPTENCHRSEVSCS